MRGILGHRASRKRTLQDRIELELTVIDVTDLNAFCQSHRQVPQTNDINQESAVPNVAGALGDRFHLPIHGNFEFANEVESHLRRNVQSRRSLRRS